MLYKITIENFFSIADQQELIFAIPQNAPDLMCFKTSRANKNIRLPAVVGFFGPNASGKSTILNAITSLILFSCNSFWAEQQINLFQPYRQKNWWDKPTRVSIEFEGKINSDEPLKMFRYELHINHVAQDLIKNSVAYEALSYAPEKKFRKLFERKNQEFHFTAEFAAPNDSRKESISPNVSVISTLAKLNHQLSIYLRELLMRTLETNRIGLNKVNLAANQWLSAYVNDKSYLDQLNRELRRLDVGLEYMVVEQGPQGLFAKFKHAGLDDFIFLAEESSGTQRFIEIFPRLHYVLTTGSIAVIDELDNDLHPFLLPELLRWFSDEQRNPHGAQLLFSAHNPALLDELEKEQVFFTEKLTGQPSRVYGARDIKGLRREPSLMKKYLSGELGAVPHIG